MEIKSVAERFAETAEKAFEELRKQIADNIRKAGKWASGKTAESMVISSDVAPTKASVELLGRKDFYTLESGNPPANRPLREFSVTIREWSIAKGIPFTINMQRSIWSYRIAKRINKYGDSLYRSGKRKDIYTTASVDTMTRIVKSFDKDVEVLASTITTEIANNIYNDINTRI